jgi:hypothetical protein
MVTSERAFHHRANEQEPVASRQALREQSHKDEDEVLEKPAKDGDANDPSSPRAIRELAS